METTTTLAKKRGPKPSGVKKVVLFKRVTEGEKAIMNQIMDKVELSWNESFSRRFGEWVAAGCPENVQMAPEPKESIPKEDLKAKADTKALLDNIDQLTKEVDYWRARFEKAVQATEHQMAIYWKDRANKAEQQLKKGEFDQT